MVRQQRSAPNPTDKPPRNRIAWVVFFCLSVYLMLWNVEVVVFYPDLALTLLDYLSLLISFVSLGGLFGFAFYLPVLNVVFWRYFFYVALGDFLLFSFILPLLGVSTFGQHTSFDIVYVVGVVYSIAVLYALNQYAYKRGFIWEG